MTEKKFHRVIWGVKKGKEKGKGNWNQLGVTFLNKDGSENLRFNYVPTDPEITIQLRDPKEKPEG